MDRETTVDLSEILDRSHADKWVAISPDYRKVVASAENLPALIHQMNGHDVIFHRVLPGDVGFVPLALSR